MTTFCSYAEYSTAIRWLFSERAKADLIARKAVLARLGTTRLIIVGYNNLLTARGGLGTVMRSIREVVEGSILVCRDESLKEPAWREGLFVVPFQLDKEVARQYHTQFLKNYIWPLFHGLDRELSIAELIQARRQETRFISSMIDTIKWVDTSVQLSPDKGTIVWLNDYALVFCANALREYFGARAEIVLSLRCPFGKDVAPALDEIDAARLVKNFLGVDRITMHSKEDIAHLRSLLEQYAPSLDVNSRCNNGIRIKTQKREIMVDRVEIGQDIEALHSRLDSSRTGVFSRKLDELTLGRLVICGASRLEPHKGIIDEIDAVRAFLEKGVYSASQVVYIRLLAVFPEYVHFPKYKELLECLRKEISLLNTCYGFDKYQPAILLEAGAFEQEQIFSLFAKANVILSLPVADGFNHMMIEAILCQIGRAKPAGLIFRGAGCLEYLVHYSPKPEPRSYHDEILESIQNIHFSQTNYPDILKDAFSGSAFTWAQQVLVSR